MAGPVVRAGTVPTATLAPSSPASTAIGDLVIVITWTRGGAGVPTHTLQSGDGFAEIRTHSHDDGSTDGRLSVARKVATSAGANSYQAYTSSAGSGNYSGIVVLQVGTWENSLVGDTSNSSTLTTNGVPNPPAVVTPQAQCLVLVIGAWHISAATVAITAPTNYTEVFEMAGSNDVELSVAQRTLAAAGSEDPGAFTDDVAPNGSVSMTIAFRPRAVTMAADSGTVSVTGNAATLTAQRKLVAQAGSFSVVGNDTGLTFDSGGVTLAADAGTFAVAGNAAGLGHGYRLTAAPGSFSVVGNATALRAQRKLAAESGTFAVAGHASSLNHGFRMLAAAAAFVLVGNAVGLAGQRKLVASPASFSIVANPAALQSQRKLAAQSGSYLVSGSNAGLSYSGGANELAAAPGSFVVVGNSVGLRRGLRLAASAGAFAVVGMSLGLLRSVVVHANGGSFALLAADAALLRGRRLAAEPGSFGVAGSSMLLHRGYALEASAGGFGLSGGSITMASSRRLAAQPGAFVLVGGAVGLLFISQPFDASPGTSQSRGASFSVPSRGAFVSMPVGGVSYEEES